MTYDEITEIMCKVHDPKEVALNKAFSSRSTKRSRMGCISSKR